MIDFDKATAICDECVSGCVEIIAGVDAAALEYASWNLVAT